MDSFNKVISFILGLVVVIVFFAVVTGKIKLPGKTTPLFGTKPTPTPEAVSTTTTNQQQTTSTTYNQYQTNKTISTAKKIPATGTPTFFIPSLLFGAVGGSFLRKAGKK
ncbi:MAG: hypothetical protein ACPLRN_00290 [Microgenomates group bacterium]